jgi:hypothetical protein
MDTDDGLRIERIEQQSEEEYYCDGLEALDVTEREYELEREHEEYWAELLDAAERQRELERENPEPESDDEWGEEDELERQREFEREPTSSRSLRHARNQTREILL